MGVARSSALLPSVPFSSGWCSGPNRSVQPCRRTRRSPKAWSSRPKPAHRLRARGPGDHGGLRRRPPDVVARCLGPAASGWTDHLRRRRGSRIRPRADRLVPVTERPAQDADHAVDQPDRVPGDAGRECFRHIADRGRRQAGGRRLAWVDGRLAQAIGPVLADIMTGILVRPVARQQAGLRRLPGQGERGLRR